MKKFSERSRRGQQRILICAGGAVCMLLIAVLMLTGNKQSPYDYIMNIGKETPVPSKAPEKEQITPTPTPGEIEVLPGNEETAPREILADLFSCILDSRYYYGAVTEAGIVISNNTLDKLAGISEYGKEITVNEVTAGDVGMYGNSICVCVGQDKEGNPLFAYATPHQSYGLPEGGIYVGYSMEQNDAMFCGMYPVPCAVYFDCCKEEVANEDVIKKAENYRQTVSSRVPALYDLGRAFSRGDIETVMDAVPENVLREQNVRFRPEELSEFLKNFPEHADIDDFTGTEYCFREINSFRLATGRYLKVELLSLSAENFLMPGGNWNMTFMESGILPFLDYKLDDYIGWGFEKDKESVYTYDEEGNITGYEIVDAGLEESITVTEEDGNSTYTDPDYSMTLGDEEMFLTETNTIIPLGDYQYLLISDDAALECDMSEYAHRGKDYINEMLERMLERMKVESGDEERFEEEPDEAEE